MWAVSDTNTWTMACVVWLSNHEQCPVVEQHAFSDALLHCFCAVLSTVHVPHVKSVCSGQEACRTEQVMSTYPELQGIMVCCQTSRRHEFTCCSILLVIFCTILGLLCVLSAKAGSPELVSLTTQHNTSRSARYIVQHCATAGKVDHRVFSLLRSRAIECVYQCTLTTDITQMYEWS